MLSRKEGLISIQPAVPNGSLLEFVKFCRTLSPKLAVSQKP
jgi:hypothetical protein